MQDVTNLKHLGIPFDDVLQVPGKKTVSHPALRGTKDQSKPRPKAKTVHFLEKFGDPENVPESESWDTATNSFENNKNLDEF